MTGQQAPEDSLRYRPLTAVEPSPCPGEGHEQLADDLLGLAEALKHKLKGYSSCPSAASADPLWAQETEGAVTWMKTTVEDLVATLVGLQAMPGKCACQMER